MESRTSEEGSTQRAPTRKESFAYYSDHHSRTSSTTNLNDIQATTSGGSDYTMHIDGALNSELLHAHLLLLIKLHSIEQRHIQVDLRYLLRAQERYLLWLNLLKQIKFHSPPVPPIDVWCFWHAHCLSPQNYYEDLLRLHGPESFEYNVPLEKLNEMWAISPEHNDERAQRIWEQCTAQPWTLDPFDNSDFELMCPWCDIPFNLAASSYVKLMRSSGYTETCPHCWAGLSTETLSVKRFLDDINSWITGAKIYQGINRYIGGTLVDPFTGAYSEKAAEADYEYLFDTSSVLIRNLVGYQRFDSSQCTWPLMRDILRQRILELKTNYRKVKLNEDLIERMINAYAGIPAPFSLDLVNAVIRQRQFTHKIVNAPWINVTDVQAQAIIRFHKYLLLMKDSPPDTVLVPTLDIDLAWRTLMLLPRAYRKFTKKHLNRIPNQDYSLPRAVLVKNFPITGRAWYKKFDEPYTHEELQKYWLTTSKKTMAVIFPPYSVWVLWKMKQYRKGMCDCQTQRIRQLQADRSAKSISGSTLVSDTLEKSREHRDGCALLPNGRAIYNFSSGL
ncbi:hypothetical protein G9A89_003896 [Geosiphon pyriformis]|nr:hypothetical protein G9A89_003896 [Geosiphon pyriformis]